MVEPVRLLISAFMKARGHRCVFLVILVYCVQYWHKEGGTILEQVALRDGAPTLETFKAGLDVVLGNL